MKVRGIVLLAVLTAALPLAMTACRGASTPAPEPSASTPATLVDSDHDGVGDARDHCPGTSARPTLQIDPSGCPRDTDSDGLADFRDKCPGTAAAAAIDEIGCELDTDADGVFDSKDRCPGTPRGDKTDPFGCEVVPKGR